MNDDTHIYAHGFHVWICKNIVSSGGGGKKTEKKKESKNEKINSKNLKIYTLR